MDFLLKTNGAKSGMSFGVIRARDEGRAQELAIDWCRKNNTRFCELRPLILADDGEAVKLNLKYGSASDRELAPRPRGGPESTLLKKREVYAAMAQVNQPAAPAEGGGDAVRQEGENGL